MEPALYKAVMLMAIALPTMFFVICLFIGLTTLLHRMFPAPPEVAEEESGE